MKEQKQSPEQERALERWAARLQRAKSAWQPTAEKIARWEACYDGTHTVRNADGSAGADSKNLRNIVYELIESQVDNTIPMPKVTAIHPGDEAAADHIEACLRGEIARLNLQVMNDIQERTVPIAGGGWWEIGWNPLGGSHCCPGALALECRHPLQVIPQPGVTEPEEMDYIFECLPRSRRYIEERYGVKLEQEFTDGETDSTELVVENTVFYRGGAGKIGKFCWVGDRVLEDIEDYQAVQRVVCAKCGTEMEDGACPACGCRTSRKEADPGRELDHELTVRDPFGREKTVTAWVMTGDEVVKRTLPRYRPREYPLVLRRNVSRAGRLLGSSDVEQIADQQEMLKKLSSKTCEKMLKGGSYVTLPMGVDVETTDRELKIIRLRSPAEKALIDVLNIQPDISRELTAMGMQYDWAKSTAGITDSYQGKQDSSAQSGVAKQFAAAQSAGRLESKRVMKNAAYAELFKRAFHVLLACATAPLDVRTRDGKGGAVYGHFDPMELLRVDEAGELYWEDEFLFEVDNSAALANNRQSMWSEARTNFVGGAYGDPATTQAQLDYWTTLARYDYPGAADQTARLERRMEEERNALSQMQN